MTKKLGSLIGEEEDVERRKHLAQLALKKLTKLLMNRGKISEQLLLRLYNAYVRPVLMYNCGTWGLLESAMTKLETFHRRQLRRVLGIFWPQKISNDDLYRRCGCRPLRFDVMQSRWKLFGHILRLEKATPAYVYMESYFKKPEKEVKGFRGRPRMTLPHRMHADLQKMKEAIQVPYGEKGTQLKTSGDLKYFWEIAQDRKKWHAFVNTLVLYNQNG